MKRLTYNLLLGAALIAAGLVMLTFLRGLSLPALLGSAMSSPTEPNLIANNKATLASLPTAVSNLPDVEYIPFYQGASVTSVSADSGLGIRQVAYEVAASPRDVSDFYRDTLQKTGWSLQGRNGQSSTYKGNITEDAPWHLYLEVQIGITLDGSKSLIQLLYTRFPDTGTGLPVYSGAQNVVITHSEQQGHSSSRAASTYLVHITEVTYSVSATAQEVTHFYDINMPQYGWFFWDPNTSDGAPTSEQMDAISSQQGLSFRALRTGWSMKTNVIDLLSITAVTEKEGQLLVTLRVEETERPVGGF